MRYNDARKVCEGATVIIKDTNESKIVLRVEENRLTKSVYFWFADGTYETHRFVKQVM
mgnify:CR=1 FL=1